MAESSDIDDELRQLTVLSDDEVLAMADYRLSPEDDRLLSDLLELNGDGRLSVVQRVELDRLDRLVTEGVLLKARGWAEAVRRRLREPLDLQRPAGETPAPR
jgi:hypothetical protein